MKTMKIVGVIVILLIVLLVFQTFQLIDGQNKTSTTGYTPIQTQVPNGGAVKPTQLPTQRGGC